MTTPTDDPPPRGARSLAQLAEFLARSHQEGPFGETKPAPDIDVLLEYLRGQNPERYLFRGQVKDYPAAIPSIYRSAIVAGTEHDPVTGIAPDSFFAAIDRRRRLRFDELNRLIRKLGKGVGNIVAQQYGFSSEAMDLTSDLDIAAFFATRSYPSYQHVTHAPGRPPGVIYAFPLPPNQLTRRPTLDLVTSLAGEPVDGLGMVWHLPYVKFWDLDQHERQAVERVYAELGERTATLTTHPVVVGYEKAREWIAEALAEQGLLSANDYEATRIWRQRGGFVLPAVNWIARVVENAAIEFVPQTGTHMFKPGLGIVHKLVGVENARGYFRIKRYYFRHTDKRVDSLTREQLWPSVDEDPLFKALRDQCAVANSEYLAEAGVRVDDRQGGLIDRGYYDA